MGGISLLVAVLIIIGVSILEFFFELSQLLQRQSWGIVQWIGGAMLVLLSFTTLEYFLKRNNVIKTGRKTIFDYFFAGVDRIQGTRQRRHSPSGR